MTIWAKSWSEIIEQCTARLRFFQERLNYSANQSSGKQFLRDTYPKFIPSFVKDENVAEEAIDEEQATGEGSGASPQPETAPTPGGVVLQSSNPGRRVRSRRSSTRQKK
jgi:hypothetical protein